MKKKIISLALTAALLLPSLALLSGCSGDDTVILRVYNWEEYIDDGGEGSYVYDTLKEELAPDMSHKAFQKWYKKEYGTPLAPSVIDDFEDWYEDTYEKPIRVEYSTFGTNEDMYNQLKLGVTFDLVCPSEYMIMKLIAEDMLEPLSDEFFVTDNELNYYLNNVSDYIADVFAEDRELDGKTYQLEKYAAGYMWGTTGFIYNPEKVNFTESAYWDTLLDTNYKNKVTTKDNVRDSYFVGLAIVHQKELLELKAQFESEEITAEEYNAQVTDLMNDTTEETVKKVQDTLIKMKSNLYGFETDSGKQDMVTGKIWINFAWSGDAVYAMDLAEKQGVELNYYIPDECANLFFDGWVMPKGANHQAAEAFINFLSMPENAVRNMYYIGYTSAIAGDYNSDEEDKNAVFKYIKSTYDEGEGEDYDLSYFFGKGAMIKTTEQNRQLYAQYPPEDVTARCAVMNYYGEADKEINELWTKVKGETLDAWAIVVICVFAVVLIGGVLLAKFGGKIDFFRRKPKKGYELVKQVPYQPKKK